MLIIVILISVSLVIALAFLGLFLWNLKSGQYDDVYTPSVRMLFDQAPPANKPGPGHENAHDKNQLSSASSSGTTIPATSSFTN